MGAVEKILAVAGIALGATAIIKGYLDNRATTAALDLQKGKDGYLAYWDGVVAYNLQSGGNWYNGIPYAWWYGYDGPRFIRELPDHIFLSSEPLWVQLRFS